MAREMQIEVIKYPDGQLNTKFLEGNELKMRVTSYTDLSIFMNKEFLLPFFIGFVDGDGSIWINKNRPVLGIHIHGSWLDTIREIAAKLWEYYEIYASISIDKKGFVKMTINRKQSFKNLLSILPQVDYLERKWNKVEFMSQ